MLLNRRKVLRTDASAIGGYYNTGRYSIHAVSFVVLLVNAVAPPQSVQRYIGQYNINVFDEIYSVQTHCVNSIKKKKIDFDNKDVRKHFRRTF